MIVSRREFTKVGVMGLATQVLPIVRAEAQVERKIGYCVIGLGRIADHFMRGGAQGQGRAYGGRIQRTLR